MPPGVVQQEAPAHFIDYVNFLVHNRPYRLLICGEVCKLGTPPAIRHAFACLSVACYCHFHIVRRILGELIGPGIYAYISLIHAFSRLVSFLLCCYNGIRLQGI